MRIRRVVSLTMFLSFIVMGFTGIMLFFTPQGRIAHWTGWKLLGLSKDQWGQLHVSFMVIFLVAGVWHIVHNWRPITTYLKTRARKLRIFTREFNVALALVLLFLVGTLAGWVPWSSYLGLEDSIKGYWERSEGAPPWGHAEENTLARFTQRLVNWERLEHQRLVRLSVADAIAVLHEGGIEVESENEQLIEIARRSDTTPQALMEIIRRAERPREATDF